MPFIIVSITDIEPFIQEHPCINLENELTKVKPMKQSASSYYYFEGGLAKCEWQRMRYERLKTRGNEREKIQSKFKIK